MSHPRPQSAPPAPRPSRRRPGRRAIALLAVAAAAILVVLVVLLPAFLGGRLWVSHDRHVTVDVAQLSVDVTVPDRLAITHVEARPDEDCERVAYAFGRDLTLEMYATGCGDLRGDRKPLNGFHGAYRSIDDVIEPRAVRRVQTSLGSARVFTQQYTECTNSCRDFDEPVAIIELDDPADPSFPSVVLRGDRGELSREELTEIVTSLRSMADQR